MRHLIFLIDTSYSMAKHIGKVAQRVDEYIEKTREDILDDVIVSVAVFNDSMHYIFRERDINYVDQIVGNPLFRDSGCTALYDSVCSIITNSGNHSVNAKTLLFVISDGEDTSSMNFTKDDMKSICENAISEGGWEITHYSTVESCIPRSNYVKINMNNLEDIMSVLKI